MTAGQFVESIRPDQKDGRPAEGRCDLTQQVDTRRVGPVKVLEQDIDRTDRSQLRQEPGYLREKGGLVADPAETSLPKRSRNRRPVSTTQVAEQIQPGTVRRSLGDLITVPGQDPDS